MVSFRVLTLLVVAMLVGACGAGVSTGQNVATTTESPSQLTTGTGAMPPLTLGDEVDLETESAALYLVNRFVTFIRAGDVSAAADLWSGYPYSGDDELTNFELFLSDFDWIADDAEAPLMFVIPAYDWGSGPLPIVVLQGQTDRPDSVGAFLVGDDYEGEGLVIHRLPRRPSAGFALSPGAEVQAGQKIVFGFVPTEGDARAFIDDQEIDQIVINHAGPTTTIVLPDSLEPGPAVLTISAATPEYPTSFAIGIKVIE